ncbi:MAG: helix-turn-helix transcriptional regulator [Candidatus Gastranaerophilales bacterium]|nr:helix-turn-helix transcriptional regulator [Candidatus Gastranaerophilales bacterium]
MNKSFVGKKIKEVRRIKGFTQAQLAEMVDMHEKHISRIEMGKYLPTFENLVKIFKSLDINLNEVGYEFDFEVHANPLKTKIIKIINNANEIELNFYLGLLEQAQRSIKLLKK